ncbi:hypothetical protein PO909_032231 [Leuciscus waleckii]
MSSFSGALSFILFLHKEQEGESILTGENNCSCLGFRCSVLPYGAGLLVETTSEIVVSPTTAFVALMDGFILVDQHIDGGGHLNITISALCCPFCPDHRHAAQLRPQYRECDCAFKIACNFLQQCRLKVAETFHQRFLHRR